MDSKIHYVVFDIETRKLANELSSDKAEGWAALKRGEGGISALAVYDSFADRTFLYDDHCADDAAHHLEEATLVVGFNSEEFDIKVLEGVVGRKLRIKRHIDILVLIWNALRDRGHTRFRGNKLEEVGLRTLGRGKIEKSTNAPDLARKGRWAQLFNYCMDDVDLTRELFEYIRTEGGVIGLDGKLLPLDLPIWLRQPPSRDNA